MLRGMNGELLSIGRFARLTGLSVGALRHYHEHGLLVPASVDPHTGYRSYSPAQAEEARLIGSLRELGLALPQVRAALAADPAARRAMLAAHRTRLGALLARTQRQIHWLNRAIDHEEPIMIPSPPAPLDRDARRRLAADLFNHTWTLMERVDRTAAQDDEMLHCAHASRYHWGEVGEPANFARGEWQCSRVYSVLGAPSRRCGMPAAASPSARSTASATGTSRLRGRRSPVRRPSPATRRRRRPHWSERGSWAR